jgi:hypothetical protein
MPNVMTASIRDKLWHKMRQDLANFVPEINQPATHVLRLTLAFLLSEVSGISAQHRSSWTLTLPRVAAPIGSAYCEGENILRPNRGLW